MRYNFKSHDEIPADIVAYVKKISEEEDIKTLPIDDINNVLNEIEAWMESEDYVDYLDKLAEEMEAMFNLENGE